MDRAALEAVKSASTVQSGYRARMERRPSSVRHYSYGATSAIATSLGLIVGFRAADVSKTALVSGLLVIAFADNISDSLSIHIYQESEGLESRSALRATLLNFVARLLVALSFVGIVLGFPPSAVPWIAIVFGMALLAAVTHGVARRRGVSPWREMIKHILVALAVIGVSHALGSWIAVHLR